MLEITYSVEITYKTGSSYSTHINTELVGCVWENIEDAIEALKSIKEHNIHFNENNSFSNRMKTLEVPTSYWYLGEEDVYAAEHSMYVKCSGELKRIAVFWRGYFECLIEAKVVIMIDDANSELLIYEA